MLGSLASAAVVLAYAVAAAPGSGTPSAPPSALPMPAYYGVYGVSGGRLFEIAGAPPAVVPFAPLDAGLLTAPPKVRFAEGRLRFLVYRRDAAAIAPGALLVNVVARVARSMEVDPRGNVTRTTPVHDLWKIREQGYRFRTAARDDRRDVVTLEAEDPAFIFPTGRYAFSLFGNVYDFLVDTEEPVGSAHCVDRISTAASRFTTPQVSYVECPPGR